MTTVDELRTRAAIQHLARELPKTLDRIADTLELIAAAVTRMSPQVMPDPDEDD